MSDRLSSLDVVHCGLKVVCSHKITCCSYFTGAQLDPNVNAFQIQCLDKRMSIRKKKTGNKLYDNNVKQLYIFFFSLVSFFTFTGFQLW